ncbi:MAG TPA: 6-phosphogluconolactonase [Dongiaceae bacterium]|nr:6-phosphogluconolactonase [Dongiaceae bacterium]
MSGATITVHRHQNAEAFITTIADRLAGELHSGLRRRGRASFAVPGGSTPGPIFDRLATCDLDWPHVAVTLTDERWVPTSDTASNEYLLRQRLVSGKAQAVQVIGLHTDAAKPGMALDVVAARLRQLPLPFDAVMLGMGGDGHFASLFPGMPALAEGLALDGKGNCVASDAPINGQPRISLTLPLLLNTSALLLAIRGVDKLQVIERAKTASPAELPIAAVLRQARVAVEIHYTD